MNIEELENFIHAARKEELVKAAEKLSETERKKLSKTASTLLKDLEKERFASFTLNSTANLIDKVKTVFTPNKHAVIADKIDTARLAVLAFCPISATRKVDARFLSEEDEHLMVKVLSDRKPDWIDEWIDEKLQNEWFQIKWSTLRTLMKNGICSKPTNERYIALMAQDIAIIWGGNKKEKYVPLSQKIKEDPELLQDEIWRLFEVENLAFFYDLEGTHANLPEGYESWATAIIKLTDEGLLERNRILDSCLNALTAGFKSNVISSFIKLFEKFNPTIEELSARQQVFVDLMTNNTSHIVTFALKILKELDQKNKLDDQAFVNSVMTVFSISTKTQPASALKILEKIIKRAPDCSGSIVMILIEGLKHESADIQEKSLKLLSQLITPADSELATEILTLKENISPSLHQKVDDLLAGFSGVSALESTTEDLEDTDTLKQELLERAKKLDEAIYKKTNFSSIVESFKKSKLPEGLHWNLLDLNILPGLEPIEPINDPEELIEAVSHAVENIESPIEVERIIDGMSRLCAEKPDTFERLSAPLLKRVETQQISDTGRGLISSFDSPIIMRPLLVAWLANKKMDFDRPVWRKHNRAFEIIEQRLEELYRRVLKKQPAILLAAPTHSNGWIDPVVLVERLIEKKEKKESVEKHDFIQALLRIAPDNRDVALEKTSEINDFEAAILRYALGAEEFPRKKDKKYQSLWAAAGRVRAPYSDLEELTVFGPDNMGANYIKPATYHWKAYKKEYVDQWSKKTYYHPQIEINVEPLVPLEKLSSDWPLQLLHAVPLDFDYYYVLSPWAMRWLSMIWPHNYDAFYSGGVKTLVCRIDMSAASTVPNFIFLDPLFEEIHPYSELAYLILCLGLVSQDTDSKGYAVDALAEGIHQGRIHSEPLSRVLIKLTAGDWVKLNRLANNFAEVSRLSSFHRLVLADTIDRWLSQQKDLPKDAHHILALEVELLNTLGLQLSDEGKKVLESIKGSSKTAKLAKALMAFSPDGFTSDYHSALISLFEGYLGRVEVFKGYNDSVQAVCQKSLS